jgi:hypothetical protein
MNCGLYIRCTLLLISLGAMSCTSVPGGHDASPLVDGDVDDADQDGVPTGSLVVTIAAVRRELDDDARLTSGSVGIDRIRVRGDRGILFDPIREGVGVVDVMSGRGEVRFAAVPPATYSSLVLDLGPGSTWDLSLSLGFSTEDARIEVVLDGAQTADVRCDVPRTLDAGDELALRLELDVEQLFEVLEESDLPEPSHGVIRVDRHTAPSVVQALEEVLRGAWGLGCGECEGDACGGDADADVDTGPDADLDSDEDADSDVDEGPDADSDMDEGPDADSDVDQDGGCGAGLTACGDDCVDLDRDPDHCGSCEVDCFEGHLCLSGACSECPEGEVRCGSWCTDLSSDEASCGVCGVVCPAGATCISGGCHCPPGFEPCAGACVDVSNDESSCGSCGNTCDAVFGECFEGECRCLDPAMEPCGEAHRCQDVLDDSTHCGGCDTRCDERERCVDGECECRPGLVRCDGECVDLRTDDDDCGSCDSACVGPATRGDTCRDGHCTWGCGEGETRCGPDGGSCVSEGSMLSDPLNCGGCGEVCDTDEICLSGSCTWYFIGRGCESCPCEECGDRICCAPLEHSAFVACVDGDECPGEEWPVPGD